MISAQFHRPPARVHAHGFGLVEVLSLFLERWRRGHPQLELDGKSNKRAKSRLFCSILRARLDEMGIDQDY
jgi:hypothetical protein